MLKPQDVLLVLKLISKGEQNWSQGGLAEELSMSSAEVNAGLKRLVVCSLIQGHEDGRRYRPNKRALMEFLVSGIRYVFPPEMGAPTVGIPTGTSAEPLRSHIEDAAAAVAVWPAPSSTVKGFAFKPLYRSAPKAVKNDPVLYELLVLVDALRDPSFDYLELARVMLAERLGLTVTKNVSKSPVPKVLGDEQLDLL